MDTYRNYDWLLGGSFDMEETDSRRESLIEALSFFIGKIESFRTEQSDIDDISAFGINEEISALECVIENITDKLYDDSSLNESPEALLVALPAAVATIMGGIPIGSALFRTWVREGTILPKGLTAASKLINKWLHQVTGAERNKRRALLAEQFKKSNPKASSTEIQAYITRIEAMDKHQDEKAKQRALSQHSDNSKSKTYGSMTDKEKAEYKKRMFPNSGKKD